VFGTLLVHELRGAYDVVPATRDTLDLSDVEAVHRFARGAYAFACAAGPFQTLDRGIVRAVVDAGAHWLDIADDERWFFELVDDRALDALARERGVAVIPGLSSLPAISYALAQRVLPSRRLEITLFIGNGNPKGAAAIASGAALQSPDRELLRRQLGVDAVTRARFEMPGARLALSAMRVFPLPIRLRIAKLLSPASCRASGRGAATSR
jgi:short subunit dehydrogenase-like uncharacterized protein